MGKRDRSATGNAPAARSDIGIEAAGLTVRYGSAAPALEDVSLRVEFGRVCGLIGVNGSGKSTLFKAIMGLVRPEAGSVRVAGEPVSRARRRNLLSYVPQHEAVDWNFPVSVREVVMMGRYGRQGVMRTPRREDREAVRDAIERVGLSALAGRQIGQLSGGQRRRAFVARGIAQGARVLLLDEPFAGVDAQSQALITALLRELAAEGAAVLVSTHDLTTLPSLADEAALLLRRLVAAGTPQAVLAPDVLSQAFGLVPASAPAPASIPVPAPASEGDR
ncbi:metal ABC transporter ATP-binding protein [Brevibacterium sp.]|uniref:metal ABC transporter ATP-binding protein n=1 Tax=Brevibacterium sp. TaxID=1701 RepID=UPI0025C16428|nr:metal ABC transporter ATP-binding protein [Brevibacterium sp.]